MKSDKIENIITKELAWFYRIIPKQVIDGKIIFLIDEEKKQNEVEDEIRIILNQTAKFVPEKSDEIERLLILKYRIGDKINPNKRVDFLEEVLNEAILMGSSDVHFEAYEKYYRLRYRIDGHLIEKKRLKKDLYLETINIIKIKSNLDITEKRMPQDGRTKMFDNDVRVSVMPTQFGEKVVLRILGKDANKLNLDSLGFDKHDLNNFKEAIMRSHGMILISGPTGSGKTTTLYATLKLLNSVKKNIITIEDPIEYILQGVNQTQLNEGIGLTFSKALRSFLRQDPDIIMLGEIRDRETSEMAVRASLTGHLVLSTIHTNSAIGTISRLIDLGVPKFLLSETLSISVAQRLVRVLCHCKKKELYDGKLDSLNIKGLKFVFSPSGCNHCHYTGYKGRRAIYEVLKVNSDVIDKLSLGKNSNNILKDNGTKSLSEKAYQLLESGDTSISEVYPILNNSL